MLKDARFRPDVKEKDRIFHAADLESLVNAYSDWTKDEQQTFQGRAYQIIQDYQLFAIATAVVKADWDAQKVSFAELKQGHDGNYFKHTFYGVMQHVRHWLEKQRFEASVHYVFETGDMGDTSIQKTLKRMFEDSEERESYRMSGWTFTDKACLPLQTADIWAYESYKQMVNRIVNGPLRKVRYPYDRLLRPEFEPYQTYWDRENLPKLLEEYRRLEQLENKSR